MSILATIEGIADWFARTTGDAKTKADIEAGEAFLVFYPTLKAAFETPEGVRLVTALNAAFQANAVAPASVTEPAPTQPEAGAHGGSIYTGEGAVG